MKNGRRKGARAELELFGLLSAGLGLGLPLRRQLAAARDGGSDAQEHDALPTWAIEVKNVDQLARPTWWRQAIVQAEREGRHVVFGGRRKPERPGDPHPTHACPGHDMAMGVMLGFLGALMDRATLRPALSPMALQVSRPGGAAAAAD